MLIVLALAMTGAVRGEAGNIDRNVAAAIAQAEDYEAELVRLHVIADSDAPDAQAFKLKVRDAVLEAVRPLLAECKDAQTAYEIIGENLEEIESAAKKCAQAEGFEGDIAAETGVFRFPERDYAGVIVPEGDYRALRVVIGAGEGRN